MKTAEVALNKLYNAGWIPMVLVATTLILIQTVQAIAQQTKNTNITSVFSPALHTLSKECKNDDANADEGEIYKRLCKGYANYNFVLRALDYRVNYGIENETRDFEVYFIPLEEGQASDYVRGDLYDIKLGDKIEWRLANGKPYAIIVHVMFYKNIGSAKTFSNPKNKVAEYVFVRGLKGYEKLQLDLQTINVPFNPNEQAHYLADKYFEQHRKK